MDDFFNRAAQSLASRATISNKWGTDKILPETKTGQLEQIFHEDLNAPNEVFTYRPQQREISIQDQDSSPISTLGETDQTFLGIDKANLALETVGSFLPGIGQALAAKDYAEAIKNNDTVGGVLAAASFLPGIGAVTKLGSSIYKPSAYMLKQMRRGSTAQKAMAKSIKHATTVGVGANIGQVAKELAD